MTWQMGKTGGAMFVLTVLVLTVVALSAMGW